MTKRRASAKTPSHCRRTSGHPSARGSDLANLAKPTEADIGSRVVYPDLHQEEEGTQGRTETNLIMQVLFNAVCERAKGPDARVVFAIDEAHSR